jgi:hypothetical protein
MALPPDIIPGKSYFAVRVPAPPVACPMCRHLTVVGAAPDPADPRGDLEWAWPVSFHCDCGEQTFPPERVFRWQADEPP